MPSPPVPVAAFYCARKQIFLPVIYSGGPIPATQPFANVCGSFSLPSFAEHLFALWAGGSLAAFSYNVWPSAPGALPETRVF